MAIVRSRELIAVLEFLRDHSEYWPKGKNFVLKVMAENLDLVLGGHVYQDGDEITGKELHFLLVFFLAVYEDPEFKHFSDGLDILKDDDSLAVWRDDIMMEHSIAPGQMDTVFFEGVEKTSIMRDALSQVLYGKPVAELIEEEQLQLDQLLEEASVMSLHDFVFEMAQTSLS